MNMGGPRGAVGRWAVRPVSWVVVGAGVVGMLLVLLVSRFPVRGVDSWFVDFRGDPSWSYWQGRWATATWGEMVFAVGIVVWLVVLLGWWGGGIVRYFAARRFRAAGLFGAYPRRHLLLIVMFLVTLVMAGVGWPFRVGEGIVGRELATKGNSFWTPNFPARPEMVEQERRGLWSVALGGWTRRERLAAFRVLIEQHGCVAPGIINDALQHETDPVMKVWEVRLMGVCLHGGLYDGVEKCLDDPDAEVRAAAADAMGLMYGMEGHPEATGERFMTGMVVPTTVSDPPIGLYGSHLSSRYLVAFEPIGVEHADFADARALRGEIAGHDDAGGEHGGASGSGADGGGICAAGVSIASGGVGGMAGRGGGGGWSAARGVVGYTGIRACDGRFDGLAAGGGGTARKQAEAGGVHDRYEAGDSPDGEHALSVKLNVSFQLGRPWFAYPMPDCYSGPASGADRRAGGARSGNAGSTRASTPLGV